MGMGGRICLIPALSTASIELLGKRAAWDEQRFCFSLLCLPLDKYLSTFLPPKSLKI